MPESTEDAHTLFMSSTAALKGSRPAVWAVGSLPPPVTGMSLLTEKVVERLKQKSPITILNFASGDSRPRPHLRALRLLRTAGCLAKLILHGRVRNSRLYVTAN